MWMTVDHEALVAAYPCDAKGILKNWQCQGLLDEARHVFGVCGKWIWWRLDIMLDPGSHAWIIMLPRLQKLWSHDPNCRTNACIFPVLALGPLMNWRTSKGKNEFCKGSRTASKPFFPVAGPPTSVALYVVSNLK
jgi:hypothetical protein